MSATILVLEDDPILQDLLREVLEDEGYHIIAADSLPALLKIAPVHADLLITDLLVNFELVGLHAIRNIRHTHPQLPALICSAAQKQLELLRPEIDQLGAKLLPKPFTIDELVSAVSRALKHTVVDTGQRATCVPAFA